MFIIFQGPYIPTEWYVGQTTGIVGLIFHSKLALNLYQEFLITNVPMATLVCVMMPSSKLYAFRERFF